MAFRNHRLTTIPPSVSHEKTLCPNCGGDGWVDDRFRGRFDGREWESERSVCKPCNGRGVMLRVTTVEFKPMGPAAPAAPAVAPVPPSAPDWTHPATYADPDVFPPTVVPFTMPLGPIGGPSVQLLAA